MANSRDYTSSFKLLKHLDRLSQWEKTGFTHPVSVNINLSNLCNHRCPLCSTRNKANVMISLANAKRIIQELKEVEVKSVGYGGGGDPACHRDLEEIIRFTKAKGLETALVSNGYGLTPGCAEAVAECCTWARISLDADGPEIYEKTHGMNSRVFDKVIENITLIVAAKRRLKSPLAFGLTYLVGPHTAAGIFNAAKLARDTGVDYIRFRPFFDWKKDNLDIDSSVMSELERSRTLVTDSFDVSFAEDRIESRLGGENVRGYGKCYAHHFTTLIDADLNVYPCCMLVDKPEYCYGNLAEKSFRELWASERRKEAYSRISLKDCPNPCMLDGHNQFLWTVKSPINHSNWI